MRRMFAVGSIIAGVLTITACTEPLPIKVDGPSENIAEACDLLGIECTASRRAFGAIELRIVGTDECDPEDERVSGWMSDARCIPRGCAENNPYVIAHEIGHALELSHVDDDDNLMAECPGTELTDQQLDTVVDAATELVNCR